MRKKYQSGLATFDVVLFIGIVVLLILAFIGGRESTKVTDDRAQIDTLKNDARSVTTVQQQQETRHAQNQVVIDNARREIPQDDFNQPISDAAVKRLCDLGAACP